MQQSHLLLMLTGFLTVCCAAASYGFAARRTPSSAVVWLASLVSLGGIVWLGSQAVSAPSFVSYLVDVGKRHASRDILALGLGVAFGFAWPAWMLVTCRWPRERIARGGVALLLSSVLLLSSTLGVALAGGAFVWDQLYDLGGKSWANVTDTEHLVLEEVAEFEHEPIRLVVDAATGRVFVAFEIKGRGRLGGGIYEVDVARVPHTDAEVRVVAQSPALFRAFGLAYQNGTFFVSRSGFTPTARGGIIEYEPQGAVTQLKDLDADGYYEYYDDLLTGLPGVRGPDPQHQNYGLAVADDGTLYIANACDFDRNLDDHPSAGTILRLSPDTEKPTVFASGFRNPFGLIIGPRNALFATDNDVAKNPGDEVNHVVEGGHYGHPFRLPGEAHAAKAGFHPPIFVATHPVSNFTGLAYADSEVLPAAYRETLLVCDLKRNQVISLPITASGDTFEVGAPQLLARISTPLDVATATDGSIYVISTFEKRLYRIRPKANHRPTK